MEKSGIKDDERFMSLLEAALILPPEERQRYLRNACESDPELLETIEQQLALEEQMGTFLLDPIARWSIDQHPFQAGDLVSGRFRIIRELGEGGMGVIYEAVDEKLQQRRALKCAKAGFQQRLSPEARAAMRVTHDNLCRIFEIHTAETIHGPVDFLCMEYLEGATLSQYLASHGPLRSSEASSIIHQLCAGLDFAHKEGLLHRDLKPNNVMLTESPHGRRVVITDFGLAREAALPSDVDLKGSGSLAGTPAYIAPELWLGAKPSTGSDVYALGVIIYQMVSGKLPFPPGTPIEVRANEMPEHPARFAAKLDRKWDRTILKCLDPNPEKRPRVEQICAVLDPPAPLPRRKLVLRALASLAVLAVLLPMFAYFKLANLPGSRPISPVRLAILPAHISPDVHSADGLLYDLSDRLRRIPDKRLVTIPVADVLQKKIRDPDSAKSRLGATHVLEYWLNRSDSKIVFRATITDARTLLKVHELEGEHEAANLKGVATALFGTVTATFELTPGVPGEQVNSSAYPYYAQATFFNRRDNRSGDLAIPLFEKAIEFDPASCLPYAGLLEAYLTKYHRSGDRQWIDRAKQALRDASSRNPDSAVVHIQAGNLYRAVGSYESALRHYLRAIQLEPSNSDAWLFVAHVYELLPEHQTDAAQAYQRAVDLQPGYYAPEVNLSNFYIHAGRYTEAEKRLRKVVELAPELPQGHSSLCAVYDVMGRFRDAEKSCHRALQLDESTAALDNFAVMFEHLGRNQDALTYYRRAIDLAPKRYQYYQGAGDCYRRLNQARQAKTAYLTGRELAADALADNPSDGVTHAVLGYYFARLADGRNAEREVAQAIRLSSDDLEVIRTSALAEEALHHRDKVLALIRGTSIEFLQSLGREPDLADFRLDSRYQAMVAQHAAN